MFALSSIHNLPGIFHCRFPGTKFYKTGQARTKHDIFNDTIANNIALGEEVIDKHSLQHAAMVANIDEYIVSLPLGYNTKIGQNGTGLSAGQKQRILIARAVYKNPDILLFDEATSALDAKNERIIIENLNHFFIAENLGSRITIYSPESGKLSFTRLLRPNTIIQADSLLMEIRPENQLYTASMSIAAKDRARIKLGQDVTINMNDFPKEEFGSLIAEVVTKPIVNNINNTAVISIQLRNNDTTNFHKYIYMEADTNGGVGEITIGEKRLIRVFLGW